MLLEPVDFNILIFDFPSHSPRHRIRLEIKGDSEDNCRSRRRPGSASYPPHSNLLLQNQEEGNGLFHALSRWSHREANIQIGNFISFPAQSRALADASLLEGRKEASVGCDQEFWGNLEVLEAFFIGQVVRNMTNQYHFKTTGLSLGDIWMGKSPRLWRTLMSTIGTIIHSGFSDFISFREVKSRLKLVKALMLKQSSRSIP